MENNTATSMGIDEKLWVYCSPIILVFGLCGNLLTLLVMLRARMSGNSTSIYLPALAIADSLVLVCGIIPEWLEMAHIVRLKGLHPWSCKIEKLIFYSALDTSIWTLVSFTFDRWLAVCFPLRKARWCTPYRAKIAVLFVVLLSIGLNGHVLWTRGTVETFDKVKNISELNHCDKPEPYTYFEKFIRPWIVFALANAIPILVIGLCNTMMIMTILKIRKRDEELRAMKHDHKANVFQTTLMCLSASFLFLFCVTPSIIILIGRPKWSRKSWYDIVKAVANLMTQINHAVNFLLYCLSGKRFRQELVSMLKCQDSPTSITALRRATIVASFAYQNSSSCGRKQSMARSLQLEGSNHNLNQILLSGYRKESNASHV